MYQIVGLKSLRCHYFHLKCVVQTQNDQNTPCHLNRNRKLCFSKEPGVIARFYHTLTSETLLEIARNNPV